MEETLLQLSYSIESIHETVKKVWEITGKYNVLAFSGDMGAGKTTFIHALCDYLRVEDKVSSPTFALINEYHFSEEGKDAVIYHMDWYRLRNVQEALAGGVEFYLDEAKSKRARCFIEWPEIVADLLQPPYLLLSIITVSPLERTLKISRITN